MTPVIFKDQDAQFREWVRLHPEGLVVNLPNLMLHQTNCSHISDLMTKAPKACAEGPSAASDLRAWAWRSRHQKLLICEDCQA